MAIRLLYITRAGAIAEIAEAAGVDWIFVDLEYRGKHERQAARDTVISNNTIAEVEAVRARVSSSQLLVRINPLGPWTAAEVTSVIAAGSDIVMLPYFKSAEEVQRFLQIVAGRVKTCLLLETLEAIADLDRIVELPGIDFFHVGLNDIHIQRGTTFMFEFLADGGMDAVATKLRAAGATFGFGGIAQIGTLVPPAESILAEHLRLGSTGVILSRSFVSPDQTADLEAFRTQFSNSVAALREREAWLATQPPSLFEANRQQLVRDVWQVVEQIRAKTA